MTTDIAISPPREVALDAMSIDDLRAELASALTLTAMHLSHLAAVWRELERRGEDLSDLRSGLWSFMPMIARGDLKAELVVKYAGYTMLLRQLATLPLPDQERLLLDDKVILVERRGNDWSETAVPVGELRAAQLSQVLHHKIVPPEDQRRRALGLSKRPPAGLTARQRLIKIAELPPEETAEAMQTAIRLTPAERVALHDAAKSAGVRINSLIRAALEQAGLLKPQ